MPGGGRILRVALVSSDVSMQSGAARCLLAVTRGLQQRDDVELVLYLSDDGPLAEQVRRDRLRVRITGASRPSLRKGTLSLLRYVIMFPWQCTRMAFWLRRDAIDVVHANEFVEFQAGVAGWLARLPRLYHVRWPLDRPLVYRVLGKVTALLATDLVAASRATAEACFRASGRMPYVIYDAAVDPDKFRPCQNTGSVFDEFGLPPETQLITLVSKLIPEKGHGTFLSAARAVAENYPTARFMLVGGAVRGAEDYAAHLHGLAEHPALRGRVIFADARTDVPRLLAASAVSVHVPSFADPFPGVVLEAMSCGCAVVAAAIGGIPEQVTDGVDGLLVPPGDADSVAAALAKLLADPEMGKRLGRAARASILARYSVEKGASELLIRYRRILKTRGTREAEDEAD